MTAPLPCPYCGKDAHAWRVRLIDGSFFVCGCRREPDEPMCHGPLAQNADTPEKATAAWNKLVVAERARIDALVGYVSPLEYAWARRRKRHA